LQFKEITKAYEILSDETKRQLYDQGGEEAVEGGGGGGMSDAHDIFSAFFGGGGRRKPSGPKKGEDLIHPIPVALEHLYNGKLMKLALTRNIICSTCNGSGSKTAGANTTCDSCDGNGIKLVTRQIGPGMIQQMQVRCSQCDGSGTSIKPKDRCTQCSGKKVVQEKKVLEVQIDKGMQDKQKIVFQGEADQAPGTVPGDVVFVLQCKKHAKFLRKGDDLLMEHKVKLVEALCGAEFVVKHLDDRNIVVKTQPGILIRPGDVKAVDDEGMPMHKNPFVKGKLYIKFDIDFPENGMVSPEARSLLVQALPAAPVPQSFPDAEEVTMQDADIANLGRNNRGGRGGAHDEDEDDDEEGRGGQRVQCAQQ
jgi:DnaJ homolog subfamily A member 2